MTTIHPSIKHNQHTRHYITLIILVLSSTLSYAQTNTITWTGLASADWHNANNWAPMTVPTAMDSVVINGFLSEPNPEVLANNTAEAHSVTIALGALLTVQASGELNLNEAAHQGISISGHLINRGFTRLNNGDNILISSGGILTNYGTLIVISSSDYSIELTTGANLINQPCGNFQLLNPIKNNGTIVNDGLFGLITGVTSTFGDFNNNGFIEHTTITVPPTAITNNGHIADFTTFLTEGSDTILNAFRVGTTPLYNITGVFFDFQRTMPAGTYDASTNSFITVSHFPFGRSNLNVVIEDQINMCTRVTTWTIDKRCDFTPVTFRDKIWNVNGPDSLWSNPYNWCPYGVPQTGEQIVLPDSSFVYYDHTGPEIINNLDNRGSLTVMTGHQLKIENQTDRSLFFNHGLIKNFGEISLSNGQRRGFQNQNTGIVHNYGNINIDNIAISIQSFQASLTNGGEFTNHTGANISLSNSKALGFINAGGSSSSFINQSGASLTFSNIDSTGMHLKANSFFENMNGGIINLSDVTSPSCKLLIDTGAEVIWDPSVDID